MTQFSPEQVRRYSRHVLLPDVGGTGQARLLASRVVVDGSGAAGRVAAMFLVAAGVGTVIVDGALDTPVRDPRFPLAHGDTGRTLAEVRRRGWAQSVAEREPGVASVSAPIRDRTGRVIAAISISVPIERLGRRPGERHAMAVVRAGQRLSGL